MGYGGLGDGWVGGWVKIMMGKNTKTADHSKGELKNTEKDTDINKNIYVMKRWLSDEENLLIFEDHPGLIPSSYFLVQNHL